MNHLETITALVTFSVPVSDAISYLAEHPWESDAELLILSPDNLRNVLSLFKSGILPASEVEVWANVVKNRRDIGVSSSRCRKLLHELANPSLTEQLSSERADYWLSQL